MQIARDYMQIAREFKECVPVDMQINVYTYLTNYVCKILTVLTSSFFLSFVLVYDLFLHASLGQCREPFHSLVRRSKEIVAIKI